MTAARKKTRDAPFYRNDDAPDWDESVPRRQTHGWRNPKRRTKAVRVPVVGPIRLSFERIREENVTRCNAVFHPLDAWSPLEYGGALAGEVGELCNILKKMKRDGVTPALMKKSAKEAADSFAYLDLTCARLGIDLGESFRKKFNEVSRRKKYKRFL